MLGVITLLIYKVINLQKKSFLDFSIFIYKIKNS